MDQSNHMFASRAGGEGGNDDVHSTQPAVPSKSCSYPWFYTIYILVLIAMTILPLIGIGSFLFVYPSYIMALLLFILVAYCQKRSSQEPNGHRSCRPGEHDHGSSAAMTSSPEAIVGTTPNRIWFSYFVSSRANTSSTGAPGTGMQRDGTGMQRDGTGMQREQGTCSTCSRAIGVRGCLEVVPLDRPPSYGDSTSADAHHISDHETDVPCKETNRDDDNDSIPPSYNDVMYGGAEPMIETFV